MYKVSVIIPVYNAQDYLRRCLDSVVCQTLKDIEIICVDDCSTDNSLDILNEYAARDERIKVVVHRENGGESKARNTGLANAAGKYIAFVDNDDVVDLDFYEKLYIKAIEDDADIAKGDAREIRYDGSVDIRSVNKMIREDDCKTYFIGDWWTAIFRKKMIVDNKLELPVGVPLGGDILFLNKAVIAANKVSTVDGIYYNHIMREDSGDSKFNSIAKIQSALNVFEQITDNTNNANLADIKEVGYDCVFYQHLMAAFSRSQKNNEDTCKLSCAKTTINIFNKCKRKERLIEKITENFVFLCQYLDSNDVEGLSNFLKINKTSAQIRLANMRYQVKLNFQKENGSSVAENIMEMENA